MTLAEWLDHSTQQSGVPLKVADPAVLAAIVALFRLSQPLDADEANVESEAVPGRVCPS